MSEAGLTVRLDCVSEAVAADAGPKALNLCRLLRSGLPVPAGFCVLAQASRLHLGQPAVRACLEALPAAPDRGEALARLRRAIVESPLPTPARDAVAAALADLPPGPVAVRSSAAAEDLAGHSFAGLHDTFLGVQGLDGCLDALRRCWASLWSDRAFWYRERRQVAHASAAMAVIVQTLVPAEAAGVAFTVDPVSGRRDRIVVESAFGLGEALVSGRVSPDRTTLDRRRLSVVESEPGRKPFEARVGPSGRVEERILGIEEQARPSLGPAQARDVARLAILAEAVLGSPADVEWALAGGRLWLLQARPVTAAAPRSAEDRQVWTNANTGEVVPDVMTPMTASVVEKVGNLLLDTVFRRLGVDRGDSPLFGRVAGRAYFNANTVTAVLRLFPGMGRTTITDLFGGRQDAPAGLSRLRLTDDDLPRLRANRAEVIGRTLLMLARFAVWREPAMRRLCERVRSETMGFMAEDVAAASDSALVGRAMLSAADLVRAEPLFEIGGAAVLWQGVFLGLCRRWLGESAAALASRLLAGLGNNANAQAGQDLWALAVQANAAPAVRAALDDCAGFDAFRGRIAGVEAGRAFLAAWDDFMRRHGHHARGELEAANPRWSETPDDMLDQVRACARAIGGEDFAARYRRLRRERAAAWAECRRRLRDPIRRAVFRLALDRAQRLSPMRENIKSDLVRQIAGMRRLLLELGRRWAAAGRLDRPDDIFFLRLDELARFGEEAARDGLRADVQARRREYAENQRLTPPPVVVGRYDPALDVPAAEAAAEGALTGVPVHPGVVAGPARVILRSGADTVRPGEILVAPFTDPGWTPYFLNAAAIVVDMGGVLSHGSIIAREYGIPMVANVGYATRVFRTGDRIIVDGSRGVVQRGRETRGHDILLWRRGGGSNIISPELKS